MSNVPRTYLPAAGHNWALPLYDPLTKLLGADQARRALIAQAALQPNHRVLDIGCGTGTLALLTKRLHPSIDIVGLDPDPMALARASRKAQRAALSIRFDRGFSDELPYPETSFDRVFSSFMFHHLEGEAKEKTLREVRRVLAPGGSLQLLDFEVPDTPGHGSLTHLFHSSHRLQDNSEGRILALMTQAGLGDPKRIMGRTMFLGLLRIGYYQASKFRE
jgi:ubiquinone/menaquinone biosynthesis C-methylase UbiE